MCFNTFVQLVLLKCIGTLPFSPLRWYITAQTVLQDDTVANQNNLYPNKKMQTETVAKNLFSSLHCTSLMPAT